MSSIIALLERQHQDVLGRIAATGGGPDAGAAADFVAYLESEVVSHFAIEEDLLFPELARNDSIATGPLRVMEAEHAAFRDLLAEARNAQVAADEQRLVQAAADLAALLQAHIAKEDGVLFPLARARLSAEQLRRMDAAGKGLG